MPHETNRMIGFLGGNFPENEHHLC